MKVQNKKPLLDKISNAIGDKKLYWFGTRGTDAQPLFDIPQFSGVFSQIAKMNSLNLEHDICLEEISGTRVNLDAYDLDDDNSQSAKEFIAKIGDCLNDRCLLMGYRPQKIIDTLCFSRKNSVHRVMMPTVLQRAFDFKPWVEQTLKGIGVPIIDWHYFNEKTWKSELRLKRASNPMVVRRMYSSGGSGVFILNNLDDIDKININNNPQIVSVSKLLAPSYSLSINAVIFKNQKVTLHSPSVQILGKKECTDYDFGFCGNDFGAIQSVPDKILIETNNISLKVGKWLHSYGYIGAFGIDLLVFNDKCYLAEINPRFLGSSQVGVQMDRDNDRSNIYINHIAAFLDVDLEDDLDLLSIAKGQKNYRHIIYHKKRHAKEKVFTKNINNRLMPEERIIKKKGCIIGQSIEYKSLEITNYLTQY